MDDTSDDTLVQGGPTSQGVSADGNPSISQEPSGQLQAPAEVSGSQPVNLDSGANTPLGETMGSGDVGTPGECPECDPVTEFPPSQVVITSEHQAGLMLEDAYTGLQNLHGALQTKILLELGNIQTGLAKIKTDIESHCQPCIEDAQQSLGSIWGRLITHIEQRLNEIAEMHGVLTGIAGESNTVTDQSTTLNLPTSEPLNLNTGEPLNTDGNRTVVDGVTLGQFIAVLSQAMCACLNQQTQPAAEQPAEQSSEPIESRNGQAKKRQQEYTLSDSPLSPGTLSLGLGLSDIITEPGEQTFEALDPPDAALDSPADEAIQIADYFDFTAAERLTDAFTVAHSEAIKIGQGLLTLEPSGRRGHLINPDSLVQVALWIANSGDAATDVRSGLVNFWSKSGAKGIANALDGILRAIGIGSTQPLRCLMAVKAAIEWMDSVELSVDSKSEFALKGGVHLSPEIFHVGAGVGYDKTAGEGWSVGARVHALISVAAELIDQLIAAEVPTEVGGVGDFIESYLNGLIPLKTLQYLVRLVGATWGTVQAQVLARRERAGVDQLIQLWLRKELTDDQVQVELRARGVLLQADRDRILSLAHEIPSAGEVITLMVRNVFDAELVERFKLNDEFDKKYAGQLRDWGQANGLSDDVVRALWRAHWVVPSPGQLYEMVIRLRPGRVDPSIVTTIEDAARALGENDVLPFWRARLLAVAYKPLSRLALRTGYNAGTITRDDFIKFTMDLGFDDINAEKMAQAADVARVKSIVTHAYSSLYKERGLPRDQAENLLAGLGYQPGEIKKALDQVDVEIRGIARKTAVASLKKRALKGEHNAPIIQQRLQFLGFSPQEIVHIQNEWQFEAEGLMKEESVADLVKWLEDGLIDAPTVASRLVVLGYSPADANLILADALRTLDERRQKTAETAAKTASAQTKAQQAAVKAQTKAAQAAAKSTAAALAKQAKALAARVKAIEGAAADIAVKQKVNAAAAAGSLETLVEAIMLDPRIDAPTAESILVEAVGKLPTAGVPNFRQFIVQSITAWYEGAGLVMPVNVRDTINASST